MITYKNIITDYDIQALVDNELDWEDEKIVRHHISENQNAGDRYKELIHQKKLLKRLWD